MTESETYTKTPQRVPENYPTYWDVSEDDLPPHKEKPPTSEARPCLLEYLWERRLLSGLFGVALQRKAGGVGLPWASGNASAPGLPWSGPVLGARASDCRE